MTFICFTRGNLPHYAHWWYKSYREDTQNSEKWLYQNIKKPKSTFIALGKVFRKSKHACAATPVILVSKYFFSAMPFPQYHP